MDEMACNFLKNKFRNPTYQGYILVEYECVKDYEVPTHVCCYATEPIDTSLVRQNKNTKLFYKDGIDNYWKLAWKQDRQNIRQYVTYPRIRIEYYSEQYSPTWTNFYTIDEAKSYVRKLPHNVWWLVQIATSDIENPESPLFSYCPVLYSTDSSVIAIKDINDRFNRISGDLKALGCAINEYCDNNSHWQYTDMNMPRTLIDVLRNFARTTEEKKEVALTWIL